MSRYKVKSKRHKKRGIAARYAALPEKKRQNHPGRAIALFVTAVVLLGIYVAGIALRDTKYVFFSMGVTMVYYLALPLLIVIFVILNKGISNDVPTREQLVDTMTDEEKDAFIEEVKGCRRRSRPLLIPIIPLALIVAFDFLFDFFFA